MIEGTGRVDGWMDGLWMDASSLRRESSGGFLFGRIARLFAMGWLMKCVILYSSIIGSTNASTSRIDRSNLRPRLRAPLPAPRHHQQSLKSVIDSQ